MKTLLKSEQAESLGRPGSCDILQCMARLCPDDKNQLEQETLHNIQVDFCHKCGGIWLDQGEIVRVRKLAANQIKEFEVKATDQLPGRSSAPPCPVCNQVLQPFNYAGGGATLERCPNLHGLWVPASEVEKIAAMSNPNWQAQVLVDQEQDNADALITRRSMAANALMGMSTRVVWPGISISQPYNLDIATDTKDLL